MAKWQPYALFGGAYSDDSLAWTRQDTVNYLPIRAERPGARSVAKFEMVPGMRVFASIGTGPHRGGRDVEGKCFIVSGNKLYQITTAGVATELGTVPGTGPVCMTHNQIDGGNQVVIGNGTSGYVYDTSTNTFAQITDAGFPGLVSTDFLGQYVLGVEPQRRFWFHSALNDATDYNTLDRYTAESSPDRIVGLIASHSEVLVFGERSIEPWVNDPVNNAAATAFQRNSSAVIEVGCASAATICRLDNSVFFLSNHGQVMRLNGYTPVPVSTRAMEAQIAQHKLSRAFAFTYEDRGHVIYYITFPDGQTWGYDVTQGEWARRESYGLSRWRLNTLFKWNGHWFGGDSTSAKLYKLDWDYALDGCDRIVRRRVGGIIHNNGNLLSLDAVRIGYNTGADESVIHDGASITGAAPDGTVGDTISYQYTITRAFPGQDVVPVVTGTLPPGLSLSSTGLLSGTLTADGAYSWTITLADDCGNTNSLTDSVTVKALVAKFDGASDYLTTPYAAPILGSGDFTVQARVSVNGSGDYGIMSGRNSNIRGWALSIRNNVLVARLSMNTGLIDGVNNLQGGTVPANQLVHVAWTRQGNLFTLWINGQSVATKTQTGTIDEPSVAKLGIGTSYSAIAEASLAGYIDWAALTVGTCLYTSQFTPPKKAADVASHTSALDFNEPIGTTTFLDLDSRTWTTNGDVVIAAYPY